MKTQCNAWQPKIFEYTRKTVLSLAKNLQKWHVHCGKYQCHVDVMVLHLPPCTLLTLTSLFVTALECLVKATKQVDNSMWIALLLLVLFHRKMGAYLCFFFQKMGAYLCFFLQKMGPISAFPPEKGGPFVLISRKWVLNCTTKNFGSSAKDSTFGMKSPGWALNFMLFILDWKTYQTEPNFNSKESRANFLAFQFCLKIKM